MRACRRLRAPDIVGVSAPDSDVAYFTARGQRPVACSDGTSWIKNERYSFVRSIGALGGPDARERRILFWERWAPLVSFIEPAGAEDGNALFYSCGERAYDVERLPKKSRRDVRRGQRAVDVRRIDFHELARLGYPAWADTRARNRAGVPPPSTFVSDCRLRARFECQAVWGAFAGTTLAAWMTTHRVRDRMDLGGVIIDWQHRHLCASYALVYTVVRAALVEEGVAHVGYGLSSLQAESRAESLHQFKMWLGFDAVPVVRRFELHPLVATLKRPWALDAAGALLARAPQHRMVRKLRGALLLMRTA